MILSFVLFIILSSGSVIGATIYHKRYEELLPVTGSLIVMVLFLCGIAGNLRSGIYIVLGGSILTYVFAAIILLKKKKIIEWLKNMLTPAFFVFLFLFLLIFECNRGKLADAWDEFSHWADIVKVMTILDDFGTNPLSGSTFQSYPPGMSLFQYFVMKLNYILTANEFQESRLYIAYQIFFLMFLMPFLKGLRFKKPVSILVSGITIFVAPTVFFSGIYTTIYIDPFLGLLSGVGIATIFLHEKNDWLYTINVLLTIAMLVLAKDAGMLFAVFLALVYIVDWLSEDFENVLNKKKELFLHIILLMVAILLPKLLWNYNIAINHASVQFSNKIDFVNLLHVILGKDNSYRITVWKSFFEAVFTTGVTFDNIGISVNYALLFCLIILMLCLLTKLYKENSPKYKRKQKWLLSIVCIQTIVYVVGICIAYMYNFSEYEAMNLASFSRYMNIGYLAIWMVLVLLSLSLLNIVEQRVNVVAVIILSVVLCVSPLETLSYYLNKEHVTHSQEIRVRYEALVDKIDKVDDASRVYIVVQESAGYEYWVLRYSVRPKTVNQSVSWSLGKPFYEGDIYTVEITADEWMENLLANYDYVALYKINDYFVDCFGELFEDTADIMEIGLYQVNKETELLEMIE